MTGDDARTSVLARRGAASDFALSSTEFSTIARLIHDRTGIVLNESKRQLVAGRLARRLRETGCSGFAAYLAMLAAADGEAEHSMLINAITTNLTSFFRESHHFELLSKQALPELLAPPARDRRLRVWSAGCSSGEEPYSIAMTVHQALQTAGPWDARILATDVDTDMIAACREGVYDADKAEAIPPHLRQRYFEAHGNRMLAVKAPLRDLVRFNPLNLLGPWPMRGPFDVIFCRNVVIYFDKDTQRVLFDRFADMLRPDGWLFIGHSESLFRVSDRFRHLGQTAYRRVR